MRKYGALQLLVPLAQQPLRAKINSAPTIFHKCLYMYSILRIPKLQPILLCFYTVCNIRLSILCVHTHSSC